MVELPNTDLTAKIIAAAIRVHRELGPGFLEALCEEALCVELAAMGLGFERQKCIAVQYRGHRIGDYRLDLLVESAVIVELKAIKELDPIHFAVVRSYLRAAGLKAGLLFNFYSVPLTIKRIGRDVKSTES